MAIHGRGCVARACAEICGTCQVAVMDCFATLAMTLSMLRSQWRVFRYCEERSDEAIYDRGCVARACAEICGIRQVAVMDCFATLAMTHSLLRAQWRVFRHCEERRDEAIHDRGCVGTRVS